MRPRSIATCVAVLLSLAAGCGSTSSPTGGETTVVGDDHAPGSGGSGGSGGDTAGHPPDTEPGADTSELVRANDRFAADLYAHLRTQPGNLAISPTSISVALGMTYGGARGEAARQMATVLHFDDVEGDVHVPFGALVQRFNDPGRTAYELRMANRLFGEQSAAFHAPFRALTRDRYGAELQPVDFIGNPDGSRQIINHWVERQTHDRIRDLLPEGSIDTMARLVLTNAVYFKGRWQHEFDPEATFDAGFELAGGQTVQVPTMHQSAVLGYGRVGDVEVLRMPYTGGDMAMYVILPQRGGLEALEREMSVDRIASWLSAPRDTEIDVSLPRFQVDPPESIPLSRALISMGMTLPFDGAADFGLMADIRPLYIQEVFHKAFVLVNEEGTEAAAATAVVMRTESASMTPSFVADHPFLFVIRDLSTGSLLFMGRVTDPRG